MNVLPSGISSDERDGLDLRGITDEVDAVHAAVNDVENSVRKTSFLGQFAEEHCSTWSLLRGLHHVGVTRGNRDGEHPERDHGREVERADSGTNTKGLANREGVHTGREALHSLAHHCRSEVCSGLDHLESTEDVTLGVGKRLAVLQGDRFGEFLLIFPNQPLQVEHDALSYSDRRLRPRREGILCGLDRSLHFSLSCLGDPGHNLLGGRVVHVDPFLAFRFDELAIDE
mmetsp:Transcript_32922/g.80068  ORF Transcript_32922/g.80068 Transcript_32922/m.80068 type:complete len:229 (+) Transcript_32922:606-1292(+)